MNNLAHPLCVILTKSAQGNQTDLPKLPQNSFCLVSVILCCLASEAVWMCLMDRRDLSPSILRSVREKSCFTFPQSFPLQKETFSRWATQIQILVCCCCFLFFWFFEYFSLVSYSLSSRGRDILAMTLSQPSSRKGPRHSYLIWSLPTSFMPTC